MRDCILRTVLRRLAFIRHVRNASSAIEPEVCLSPNVSAKLTSAVNGQGLMFTYHLDCAVCPDFAIKPQDKKLSLGGVQYLDHATVVAATELKQL